MLPNSYKNLDCLTNLSNLSVLVNSMEGKMQVSRTTVEACAGRPSSRRLSLFVLPLEIRLLIYDYVFANLKVRPRYRVCSCDKNYQHHYKSFSKLGLLFTCKGLHQEVLPIFFRVARFKLDNIRLDPAQTSGRKTLSRIRRAEISSSLFRPWGDLVANLRFLRFTKMTSSLEELTLNCDLMKDQPHSGKTDVFHRDTDSPVLETGWLRSRWREKLPFKLNIAALAWFRVRNASVYHRGAKLELFVQFRKPVSKITVENYTDHLFSSPMDRRHQRRREELEEAINVAIKVLDLRKADVDVVKR